MEKNSSQVHEYSLRILERHLDTNGHVHHAVYLEILEEARWEMITQNGYGLKRIQETGIGPVILEIQIRYGRELRLREKIRIRTQVKEYSKKIAFISQEILNEESQVCCNVEYKFGLFDLNTRKLILPNEEWLKALGVHQR